LSSSFLLGLLLFSGWTDHVAPILTKEQKQVYEKLKPEAQQNFEHDFWTTKSIGPEEYARRRAYIDAQFETWRTDRASVYLSLGAPQKITRLASTRSFWPIEIWYYASAPSIGVSSAVQFLFYQRNQAGDYRLHSPTLDTFTALLNPQSGTRGAFRANDLLTEGDIRNTMNLTPAETEIVDAALGVSKSIKGMENDSVLARATSPAEALARDPTFQVNARLVTAAHPVFSMFESWAEDGTPVIDVSIEAPVRRTIGITVSTESTELAATQFPKVRVRYQHRLYLLPGTYALTVTIDDFPYTYPLRVTSRRMSEILLGQQESGGSATPFEFGAVHFNPAAQTHALIQVQAGDMVTWRLHQNAKTLWTRQSKRPISVVSLDAPAGKYQLEARVGTETRECQVEIGASDPKLPVISYNANLRPAERARSLGRQWLARGQLVEARTWLTRAQWLQPSDAVTIDLARVAALAGDLDTPRKELLAIIARDPNSFEALTVLGFIEAQLQDYGLAADYYRKALALHASPAVSKALEQAISSEQTDKVRRP